MQIADLPPKLWSARKNIVLAALAIGDSYPSWHNFVPDLKHEIASRLTVDIHDDVSYKVQFKFRLLIADLGVKKHVLNMMKFNGFYGCHYCTAKGSTIGRTHAYYPYNQPGQIRESRINEIHVSTAETLSVKKVTNVAGVIGKSAFADLVTGLPLTAPFDYMHCILLGVFPDVLKLCYRSLSSEKKSVVAELISELSCPRELIAFSRKVRSLDEMAQFKANELFNWLLYLSPIVFLNRIPNIIYDHLTNLSFGVRLLLESSSEENVSRAENFLNQFCQEIVSLHGNNERIETINVHSLKHLPDQVRRFGPLHCQSAMSFEAANRTLGEVSSGSNSECEIICRRIPQRHKLINVHIEDKKLHPLFSKLTGTVDKQFGPDDFIETKALIEGRQLYPGAIFTNRHVYRNTYFDSPAYKRSKSGNCFVCFFYENVLFLARSNISSNLIVLLSTAEH